MAKYLSNRVKNVKPYLILTLMARAMELKQQGKDIINLGIGEPDFNTPQNIKNSAIEAIKDDFTKYTQADGIPSLKQAVAKKFLTENQLEYEDNQIIVAVGARGALYNLFQAILNKGDEVIIPAPYWPAYPEITKLAEAVAKIIKTDIKQNFKITAEQLEKAISPATKLLVLNSPSNPSGAVYSAQELRALANVLAEYPEILVVSDDIYEHIRWDSNPFINIAAIDSEMYYRTVVVNGVSKAYAMTGWRIGYAAGPVDIIQAMKKIQVQSVTCPNSIAQIAAQTALQTNQQSITKMAKAFQQRHDFIVPELNAIAGTVCLPSEGTFYCFPNVEPLIAKFGLQSDVELAEFLLNEINLVTVPGSAFGFPGHLRISFAVGMDKLQEALERIHGIVGK